MAKPSKADVKAAIKGNQAAADKLRAQVTAGRTTAGLVLGGNYPERMSVTRLGRQGEETFEVGFGDIHVITLTLREADALATLLRAELDLYGWFQ